MPGCMPCLWKTGGATPGYYPQRLRRLANLPVSLSLQALGLTAENAGDFREVLARAGHRARDQQQR